MDRLGDAERAAVGDAAGRLVGVDAVDLDERIGEVVGAGDDVEQAGRELRGVRRRVGVAVVGDGLDLEAGDAAFLRGAQLGVDVVVAGERVRLEVLRAILDPLDGLSGGEAGHHGQDVARIDRHLAAEAAADVVRLDPDLVLGQPGHERQHGTDGVRRLARHVQRQVAVYGVPVGDAAAGLDRGHVDARDVDVLRHAHVRLREGRIGGGAVTGFPVPDVVVGLLGAAVGAQDLRSGLERLLRIDDDRQRLVVDEHRRDPVGRDVAVGGHDRRDLLGLVHDRVGRQHHLLVAGERGHPVEPRLLEVGAGDHGQDAGDLQRLRRVDAQDLGMGVRAADDVHPELAGQVEVVDVLALAADEARVLLALDGVAHAPDFEGGRGPDLDVGHLAHPAVAGSAGASTARKVSAACWIALTMLT